MSALHDRRRKVAAVLRVLADERAVREHLYGHPRLIDVSPILPPLKRTRPNGFQAEDGACTEQLDNGNLTA